MLNSFDIGFVFGVGLQLFQFGLGGEQDLEVLFVEVGYVNVIL